MYIESIYLMIIKYPKKIPQKKRDNLSILKASQYEMNCDITGNDVVRITIHTEICLSLISLC